MCGLTCNNCGRCKGVSYVLEVGVCPHCGAKVDEDVKKCAACGTPISKPAGGVAVKSAGGAVTKPAGSVAFQAKQREKSSE